MKPKKGATSSPENATVDMVMMPESLRAPAEALGGSKEDENRNGDVEEWRSASSEWWWRRTDDQIGKQRAKSETARRRQGIAVVGPRPLLLTSNLLERGEEEAL